MLEEIAETLYQKSFDFCLHLQMESLIMENKTLRNHRSSAAQENHLPNGLDSEQLDLDSDMNHVRQQSRRPGRPSSMIEMRDSSRHFVHSVRRSLVMERKERDWGGRWHRGERLEKCHRGEGTTKNIFKIFAWKISLKLF